MKRKIILAVLIVAAALAGLAGVKALQIKKLIALGAAFGAPPETGSSAVAREEKEQGLMRYNGKKKGVQARRF